MNKKQIKLLTAVLTISIASLVSSGASADAGQFYIAPGIQAMNFDNGTDLDNDEGYFFGIGYDFTDRLSVELNTTDLDPELPNGTEIDIDHWKVDVLYGLDMNIGPLEPYVLTGFGNSNFQGSNDTLWNFGAGVNYKITDNISWRTSARSLIYQKRDNEDSDFAVETALVFRFGGSSRRSSPAPAPAPVASTPRAPASPPADADGDGVPDSQDDCPNTPRNYAVDENGCPIAIEEVARVELQVNFEFDRAVVRDQYFDEIQEVADFMDQYSDVIIELEGHTDSVGTDAYNQGLSQRRADAVRDVLVGRFDVAGSRITARGFGESQPIASNATPAGREQNRRVITVIIKTLQNYQPR
jgi:OOP family OmpA-OmpF porin